MFNRLSFASLFLPLALAVSGCAGDTGTDAGTDAGHEDHGVEEELCEHMAEGPAQSVTAGADLAGAPDVSTEHTRFDVALIDDGAGSYSGSVSFAADEEGELIIGLNDNVDAAFFDGVGGSIAVEALKEGSEECDDMGAIHTIDVAVGSVELRFGPTDASEVSLVIEHGAHED